MLLQFLLALFLEQICDLYFQFLVPGLLLAMSLTPLSFFSSLSTSIPYLLPVEA